MLRWESEHRGATYPCGVLSWFAKGTVLVMSWSFDLTSFTLWDHDRYRYVSNPASSLAICFLKWHHLLLIWGSYQLTRSSIRALHGAEGQNFSERVARAAAEETQD